MSKEWGIFNKREESVLKRVRAVLDRNSTGYCYYKAGGCTSKSAYADGLECPNLIPSAKAFINSLQLSDIFIDILGRTGHHPSRLSGRTLSETINLVAGCGQATNDFPPICEGKTKIRYKLFPGINICSLVSAMHKNQYMTPTGCPCHREVSERLTKMQKILHDNKATPNKRIEDLCKKISP